MKQKMVISCSEFTQTYSHMVYLNHYKNA